MIDLSRYSLPEKAVIVAREIVKHSHDPFMIRLAHELKTPDNDLEWVKKHIKYKREKGDILYEPETSLAMGQADCEDLTLWVGTLAKIQGYPVRIRIISNGTRHIYPIIKVGGKWRAYDATPHPRIITDDLGMPINRPYHVVIDGYITDDISNPLSGFIHDVASGVAKEVATKIIMSKIGIGGISNMYGYKTIDVSTDYVPKSGDHLLFYYKPKWYLPKSLEVWLIKQILKRNVKGIKILSANYRVENGEKYLVVETEVLGSGTSGLGSLMLALTVGMIAAAIIGGGLATYFTLAKVQKIIKMPQAKGLTVIIPYALLLGAGAMFLSEVVKLSKQWKESS